MTGQPRSVDEILMDRLKTTQAIAAANAEHLRLNQLANGLMVLELKDARDGVADHDHDTAQEQNDAALHANLDTIEQLEARLSELDAELEAAVKEQD